MPVMTEEAHLAEQPDLHMLSAPTDRSSRLPPAHMLVVCEVSIIRDLGDEMRAVINVLAPSTTGRHRANRQHRAMVVDENPDLSYAFTVPTVTATLQAKLTTAETQHQRRPKCLPILIAIH